MIGEKRFATAADVRMRLNETFVKYGNDYFYAIQKDEGPSTNLTLCDVISRKSSIIIDANDPALDVSSLPLGYCQYPTWNDSVFMSRMPYRRQKQAVSVNSVAVYNVWNSRQHLPDREYFHQEGFVNNLKGEYPTFDGVISSILKSKEKKIARAFDRCFCILHVTGEETLLHYNCTKIGVVDLPSKTVTLLPEHNHSVFTLRLAELGARVAE